MTRAGAASAAVALLLCGCSSLPSQVNPVSWWHDLEGGQVAAQRPPPPNADQPYPNLATVPAKPKPVDPAQRTQIANALIADRANAHYAAAQAPLPVAPPRGGAQPALFGAPVPPAPPVDPDASSASLPGASAPARPVSAAPPSVPFGKTPPPAPATPPSRAPRTAVSSAPLAAPPPQTAAAEAAAAPTIPDAPPPAPVLPGVDIPVTVPTPKLVAPTPATKPGFERLSVPVAFAPGSAIVPPESKAPLIALVKKFGGATAIAVTGFGDSTSTSPQAQDAAVRLALLRAHAIADVYTGFGVPTAKLRLDAQAAGSGGEAHLTD